MTASEEAMENEQEKGHVLEEFKEIQEVKSLIGSLENSYNDQIARETSCERFTFIVDKYQEQPHLIDPHLESLMMQIVDTVRNPRYPPALKQEAFKYLYLITKMRGFKIVIRYFPHEVADVEPVLSEMKQQNPQDFQTWESRYMLLLWISVVCMIPFDMVRLDSNVASEDGEKKQPVMDRILNTARVYLTVNDKCRDAAAFLAAKFCTRPDVRRDKLPEFLDWSLQVLHNANMDTIVGNSQVGGVLTMLGLLFKLGKREDLLQFAEPVLRVVEKLELHKSKNTLLRKASIKVTQRLGLIFLKARVATWRYQRGNRSLLDNLQKEGVVQQMNQKQDVEEEEGYDIAEELEDVIEYLLSGLKDKDTIVRWSAAKGIGRVTCRLPQELADEVVESVLQLFTLQETEGAWHGGCLTLAELGRRGLLLPQRLPDVVPVVLRSLEYDERRGDFSVGANVRDAACYVCWAFARAYEPGDVAKYVKEIANALVKVSIFDREVNVRRAAAAAFQENVGRQGIFPHGIEILTHADYFAVGNRSHCYLDLSVYIAQFPEYTIALINHLMEIKVVHWDCAVRELSARGLHNLTPKAPKYMANCVLPKLIALTTGMDLFARHGSILTVAEITHALAKVAEDQNKSITDVLSKEVIDGMKNIVKKLKEKGVFRGWGGDLMRRAVTCLIEKLSLAKLPYHADSILDLWQELIIGCLQHTERDIQVAAAQAIPVFYKEYYMDSNGGPMIDKQELVLQKYTSELKSQLEFSRMGFSLALGALPKFFVQGKLDMVLTCLIEATAITEKEKKWVEARRDAVTAITDLCKTVGVGDSPSRSMCAENVPRVYDSLLVAMTDYTLDSRGDVGAWVREASMTGLMEISSLLVNNKPELFTSEICKRAIQCLVQQCCEKIDRTRSHAGQILSKFLYHDPEIPHIPHRQELLNIFPRSELEEINWAAPSDTFSRFTKLLGLDTYIYNVLLGFTVSVGGLTESLVIHSSASLQVYLRSISKDLQKMSHFGEVLLQIFKDFQKVDRVSYPMLKMLDQLLSKGCFDVFMRVEHHQFPLSVIELVRTEVSRCGDPQKLMASVEVYCDLLQFEGEPRKKSLQQLTIQLCHRYPRVRKATANKLYEALVTYDEIVPEESLDEITTILSEFTWDEEVEIDKIRQIRNNLCDLMKIPRPLLKKVGTQK
ncbi:tubulin-specific chaperone D-like [Ostrea edulis]|uniref:tubulin-specific chaperone D-like n=1 Tax=Ostrea edulis TaxID=37623 RepID=UPI0024AF62D8|nr:tubulin-specific chaperone D-like [Ostrea edulis]